MSIHSVNVEQIRLEVDKMILELDNITERGELIKDYTDYLKNKFKFLYKSSDGLFNYILNNYGSKHFNKDSFYTNINMMLSLIVKMQSSNISQHDASVVVGEELARQFIPQLRNNKK